MNKLKIILDELLQSKLYTELLALKLRIIENSSYINDFKEIQNLQKKLVIEEVLSNTKMAKQLREEYQTRLLTLENQPLIHVYLEELNELNSTIHMIEEIINSGINPNESLP